MTALSSLVRQALHLPTERPVIGPLLAIAGVGIVLAGGFAYAAGWLTPDRLSAPRIVKQFTADFGPHPGFRRNHAKGVCVTGYFEGNGAAARYSTAEVFTATRTPVVGRFAIPGGNPMISDSGSPVRSMALMFQSPHGEQWRTGMNNTPLFVVNTPQAFYENLVASKPDPATKKPDPAKLKAFFDAHPESAPFRAWLKDHPPSSMFSNASYFSINAFKLIDGNGHEQYVRWAMVPEQAYAPVDPAAGAKNPNFLEDNIDQQLAAGPLHWHLALTLAQTGDVTDDATKMWPADRTVVDAGTLTLERSVAQADGPCRDVNFDPLIPPHGIAPSADPLLAARSGAYSRSFNLRTHEEAAMAKHAQGETR